MAKIKDVKTALKLFEKASKKHGETTEQGDYKIGNKSYDEIISAVEFLKEKNAIANLVDLLSNPSTSVRIWAASHLLATHEKDGIKVLEEIKSGTGIHSFIAETTLSEWKKGNLKI